MKRLAEDGQRRESKNFLGTSREEEWNKWILLVT